MHLFTTHTYMILPHIHMWYYTFMVPPSITYINTAPAYHVLLEKVLYKIEVFWHLVFLLGKEEHLGFTEVGYQILQ